MKIGYVGLGKMGKNMVLRLLEHGHQIVAWNRSPEPVAEVVAAGAIEAKSIEELVSKLEKPRVVWLMLPAGDTTQEFIDKLSETLEVGDLVVDGANSNYEDTLRRNEQLKAKGLRFMDVGVSGGPGGARNGACLMVGGTEADVLTIRPILESAALSGAWEHFGPTAAGHFCKMVHNGIEYGMMQAIGEGAAVLKASQFGLKLAQVFNLYNKRSVIESRLVGWTAEALSEDETLKDTSSTVAASGEGEWTVIAAKKLGVDVPIIEGSLKIRQESVNIDPNSHNGFRNKVVSAQRGKFGGHKVKI